MASLRIVLGLGLSTLIAIACSSSEPDLPPVVAPDAGPTPTDAGPIIEADAGGFIDDSTCAPKGGSRLKVRWLVAADGARVFGGMYDPNMTSGCRFHRTADGKMRCLPVQFAEQTLFSDDQCTTPVMRHFTNCAPPAFFAGRPAFDCDSGATLYRVGAKLAAGGTYYRKNGTGCTEHFASTEDHYALTAMPDSSFVEATAGSAKSARHAILTWEGADGSRACRDDFEDTSLAAPVAIERATDAKERLVPTGFSPDGFTDSTCQTPAASVESECGGQAPKYTNQWSDGCAPTVTVRAIGAETTTPFDGACVAVTPPPAPAWRAVGPALDPTTFAEVTTVTSGIGRLQSRHQTTADGFRRRITDLYDSQTKTVCSVPEAFFGGATGPAHCFPYKELGYEFYRDPGCTMPLFLVAVDPACTAADYPPAGTYALTDSCEPHAARVGGRWTAKKYQKIGTTCNDVDFPGQIFFETFDDIPAGTIPELNVVIE